MGHGDRDYQVTMAYGRFKRPVVLEPRRRKRIPLRRRPCLFALHYEFKRVFPRPVGDDRGYSVFKGKIGCPKS